LLEYQIRENLKLAKGLNNEVNKICQGIYYLKELSGAETVVGDCTKGLTPENLAIWVRDAKGLWAYSVHLYGIIFDQEAADQVFQIISDNDLEEYYNVKCLVNGNDVKNDIGIPPRQIRFVIERALRW
jgi:hypothetical protein